MKDVGVCEDDFYGNLGMDEVDMALENYEELFGTAFNPSGELFGQAGIDSLFQKHQAAPEVFFHFRCLLDSQAIIIKMDVILMMILFFF